MTYFTKCRNCGEPISPTENMAMNFDSHMEGWQTPGLCENDIHGYLCEAIKPPSYFNALTYQAQIDLWGHKPQIGANNA